MVREGGRRTRAHPQDAKPLTGDDGLEVGAVYLKVVGKGRFQP